MARSQCIPSVAVVATTLIIAVATSLHLLRAATAAPSGTTTTTATDAEPTGATHGSVTPRAASRPNFLFILADDLGRSDLAELYPNNSTQYGAVVGRNTPNLVQLAKQGMLFDEAYAAPVCAPSRCTLMTGRHIGHCTIRGNDGSYTPLLPNDTTVAAVLHEKQGYTTSIIGKWGLGDHNSTGYPLAQGFTSFYGYDSQVACHNWYPPSLYRQDAAEAIPANEDTCAVFSQDLFINETLAFLESKASRRGATAAATTTDAAAAAAAGEPWFLFLSFVTPHAGDCAHSGPGEPSGMYAVPIIEPPYKATNWSTQCKDYGSAITRQDRDIGTVLAKLDSLGMAEDTVVVFASDNGAEAAVVDTFDSMGPLRGFKRAVLEGGMRAPMIVRWPGKVAAGVRTSVQAYFPDVLPTLADLAGVQPSDLPPDLDGVSLKATLLGGHTSGDAAALAAAATASAAPTDSTSDAPRALYWEFCHQNPYKTWGYAGGWQQAVRQGDWKALRANSKGMQLYNVTADPGELHDVAAQNPGVVKAIAGVMDAEHVDNPWWPSGPKCCNGQFHRSATPCTSKAGQGDGEDFD